MKTSTAIILGVVVLGGIGAYYIYTKNKTATSTATTATSAAAQQAAAQQAAATQNSIPLGNLETAGIGALGGLASNLFSQASDSSIASDASDEFSSLLGDL